jgi:serine/threonine-protein kinase
VTTLVSGAPKAGDVLAGKYRVERLLGSGGMGIVLAATHLELEEKVALKLLLPHVTQTPDAVARFLREARAALKVRSEHVVRVLDVGRLESGAPYMVMEYLEGQDLARVIEKRGRLPTNIAVDYLLQACEALAEAHALGIIHRDLKPANLFLTQHAGGAPCIKVLDFGISKIIGSGSDEFRAGNVAGVDESGRINLNITTTTAILGTPSYMSPEQMRSTRDVDTRSDLWSLGAILYAMLSGAPPYQGESTADLCAKIIRDPPPSLRETRPDVPEGVAYAVARCLEKTPDRRFANVAELASALVEFGSPEARASLTRISSVFAAASVSQPVGTPPTDPNRATEASGERTGPARVVISYPPSRTGTASAWAETRLPPPKEPTVKGRRAGVAALVALVAVVAALLGGFVALRLHGPDTRAPASSAGAPPSVVASPIAPTAPVPQSTVATAPATTIPTTTPEALPTAPPGWTTVATTTASSSPPAPSATPSAVVAKGTAPANLPASTLPKPQKPAGPQPPGLFDDRK